MISGTPQEALPFEARLAEAKRILTKYPDRIPVVCEKALRSNLPTIEKKKFLVPVSILCGEFKYIIHKNLSQCASMYLDSGQTIYLFVNGLSLKSNTLMSEVYEKYRARDNFLYITYGAENTLGCSQMCCAVDVVSDSDNAGKMLV